MQAVAVDLASDRFDVTFDPGVVEVEAILAAIRALDYRPEVVTKPAQERVVLDRVDVAELPAAVADLMAGAQDASKPVLLEFSGPG